MILLVICEKGIIRIDVFKIYVDRMIYRHENWLMEDGKRQNMEYRMRVIMPK